MKGLQKNVLLFTALLLFASCGGSNKDNSKDEGGESNKDTASSASSKKDMREDDLEVTAAKFANAVRKRILERARKNGDTLHLPDPRNEKDTLIVELDNVVEASVRKKSENVRYVCAKFKGIMNGKDYDIDFFMKGNEPSSLKPARDALVHKVDGKAHHKYVEKNGVKHAKKVTEEKKGGSKKQKEMKKKEEKKKMKKDMKKKEEKKGTSTMKKRS